MKSIWLPYKIQGIKNILGSDGKWYCNVLIDDEKIQTIKDGYMHEFVVDLPDCLKVVDVPIHQFYGIEMEYEFKIEEDKEVK